MMIDCKHIDIFCPDSIFNDEATLHTQDIYSHSVWERGEERILRRRLQDLQVMEGTRTGVGANRTSAFSPDRYEFRVIFRRKIEDHYYFQMVRLLGRLYCFEDLRSVTKIF